MSNENNNNQPGMDELVPGHDYDNIQEFNNPAPFWWQLFFYISIVWGVGYVAYYEFLGGPSSDQELAERLDKINEKQALAAASGPTEDLFVAALTDARLLEVGKKVYQEKCAVCHLSDGGGLVGPNLTDKYWIHGKGSLMDIYKVTKDGVLEKGMIAWGPQLSSDEMVGVVAYVKLMQGQPVAVAKEPQGELVE